MLSITGSTEHATRLHISKPTNGIEEHHFNR